MGLIGSVISFSRAMDRLEIKYAKKSGRLGKKAARPLLKYLKSQIKKSKTPSLPGGPPRKRTGHLRKSFQARTKNFKGYLSKQDGARVYMAIKAWTPLSNIIFGSKGPRMRQLRQPSPEEWEAIQTAVMDKIRPELRADLQELFYKELRKNLKPPSFGSGPIKIRLL